MKRILFTALLALPMAAMAQSNDSMSNSAPVGSAMSPGSADGGSSTGSSMMGSSATSKLSLQDKKFIKTAAIAGMSEVSDGQLAQVKGSDPIKQIATKMVTDHTKANDQLMALAQQDGVTPPASVDAMHKSVHVQLTGLSGEAFDNKYLSSELMGHEMTISAFKTESSMGSDRKLKSFASATLPILEMHLSMIKAAIK